MKRTFQALMLALITLAASCGYTFAQVDRSANKQFEGPVMVGTDTTALLTQSSSAWMTVGRDSTNKGFLLPRVGDTSDVTSPQFGLTIFSHADSCYYVYKDHWLKVGSNIADYIKASEKAVANGVATLDSNGVLTKSQVPAIAITNTYVEASMTDMLALDADTGDICIRTDSSETFILQSTPATSYDNWKKLLSPGAPVTSVNGYTGVVTLGVDDIGGAASLTGSNTFSGTNSFSETPIISSSTPGHNAIYFSDASGGTGSSPTYNVIGFNGTSFYFTPANKTNAAQFSATGLTTRRTYTLPDVSGTLAIKENTTLQSVTDNDSVTTHSITVNDPFNIVGIAGGGGKTLAQINMYKPDGTTRTGTIGDVSSSDSDIYVTADIGGISLNVGSTQAVHILHNGNVGIGTGANAIGARLDVEGSGFFSGITGFGGTASASNTVIDNSGNITTIKNIAAGTSTLLPWDAVNGRYRAVQVTTGSAVMGDNNGGGTFLCSNAYYSGSNWTISNTSLSKPAYITVGNGGLSLYTGPLSAVGASFTPTQVFSVDASGNATANSFIKSGGTSSQYLMADGSVSTGGGSPLIESVNVPLSNPAGTPGSTDAQVTYDGGNYSLTIPAGTFNANDHILIRIKFMYYINISAGTTSQLKMAINGGVKYVITPPVDNTMEKGMGEVDITNVGGDTLNVVQTHDGAYLSDDMNIGVAATDAITFTLYYNQSTTTLGDELNVRPFTVEVMKN